MLHKICLSHLRLCDKYGVIFSNLIAWFRQLSGNIHQKTVYSDHTIFSPPANVWPARLGHTKGAISLVPTHILEVIRTGIGLGLRISKNRALPTTYLLSQYIAHRPSVDNQGSKEPSCTTYKVMFFVLNNV